MKTLPICKSFKWACIPTAMIILAGILCVLFSGFNLGIDFSGGTIYNVEIGEVFAPADVEAIVKQNITAATSDIRVATSEGTQALIQYQDSSADPVEQDAVRASLERDLKESYPGFEVISIDRQGAVASKELVSNAFTSVLIACVLMLIYISFRFEFWSGIAALVALVHDVLVMLSVVSIFKVQINSSLIAAVLTIVGYSINNTIVVFDRIRDNTKLLGRNTPRTEVADVSVAGTLTRSIYTTITTLVVIVILYVLGVQSIRDFALPIIVGLVAGAWSSVMLATPFWAWCHKRVSLMKANRNTRASKKK